jgi:hypothetical protein
MAAAAAWLKLQGLNVTLTTSSSTVLTGDLAKEGRVRVYY